MGKGTGQKTAAEIDKEIARRKTEAFATRLKSIPYVTEALAELTDFPRCVASGSPLPIVELSLRTAKLYEYFAPHFFTADMVKRTKPAPDTFLLAAEKMNADVKDCIAIEDSVHGVNAALAAHMRVIGFVGAAHCGPDHAEKLQGAACVIKDMRELPAAINRLLS